MSKSLWSIVVIGFVTIVLMVFLMLASLSMYKSAPAAQNAKLSNLIRERFGFQEVSSGVRDVNGDLVLRVEYLSQMDSGFSDDRMNSELGQVAEFTRRAYDGKDRKFIRRMKLTRTEIQGSGCWKRTLERELNVEHPFMVVRRLDEPMEEDAPAEKEEKEEEEK